MPKNPNEGVFSWNVEADNGLVIPAPLIPKKNIFDKRISLFRLFPGLQKQDAVQGEEDEFSPTRNGNQKVESGVLDDKFFEQNMLKPKLEGGHLTSNKSKKTCSCQILRSSSSWSLGLGIRLFYFFFLRNMFIETPFFFLFL